MTGIDTSTPVVLLKLYAQGAIGALRSLGRLGVAVYGVDRGAAAPSHSRYLRGRLDVDIDDAGPEDVEAIVEFGRRIGGHPVLIATDDVGALFVEDHAHRLRAVFRIPEQPPGLARRLYSKHEMHDLCVEHGVPTPAITVPQGRDNVQRFAANGSFPIVGRYKLLDVNPRLGNSFRLFVASDGLDVVRAMYLGLTGQRVHQTKPREHRKWLVEDFDVATAIASIRSGRLTPLERARSLRGVEETAWFAKDDPRPFVVRMLRGVGRALRRRARR